MDVEAVKSRAGTPFSTIESSSGGRKRRLNLCIAFRKEIEKKKRRINIDR